jgi:exodeoxyribonuclease VII small subunit
VPKDNARPEQYSEVVARLKDLVEALEGGELSLEQSLERFSEGVALVKKGEKLLTDAEKRIEQLLSDDGRTAPLQTAEAPPPAPARAAAPKKPSPVDDEDVPF